jgi:hypothetical protein
MGASNKKPKESTMGLMAFGSGSFDPVLELKVEQTSAIDGTEIKNRLGKGLSQKFNLKIGSNKDLFK